ncbi:MAG: uracil permease, partial [Oscillospiraceae bacterium]|nr:uracil permease [Oscillospiraceae bacterium]
MNPFKKTTLGVQHLFAMFGATVLVPTLTGLNVSVALVCAGIGTLLFHFITGHKVPVFLGSSFAYIPAIQAVCINGNPQLLDKLEAEGLSAVIADPLYYERLPYALGGIVCAGIVYVLLSLIVRLVGPDRVRSFFPAVVTGPVIVVIGMTLAPTGISMASSNWAIALLVLVAIIIVSVFCKGFFKLVPILIGLALGYIVSMICDGFHLFAAPLVNFDIIGNAAWINPFWSFNGEFFLLPKFDLQAILLVAPVALVTFMEHIGDITTNGSVVGKDFFKDPGLHRTLLGDGVATLVAGVLGGPANTTYS